MKVVCTHLNPFVDWDKIFTGSLKKILPKIHSKLWSDKSTENDKGIFDELRLWNEITHRLIYDCPPNKPYVYMKPLPEMPDPIAEFSNKLCYMCKRILTMLGGSLIETSDITDSNEYVIIADSCWLNMIAAPTSNGYACLTSIPACMYPDPNCLIPYAIAYLNISESEALSMAQK